jgi:hypothetical protein
MDSTKWDDVATAAGLIRGRVGSDEQFRAESHAMARGLALVDATCRAAAGIEDVGCEHARERHLYTVARALVLLRHAGQELDRIARGPFRPLRMTVNPGDETKRWVHAAAAVSRTVMGSPSMSALASLPHTCLLVNLDVSATIGERVAYDTELNRLSRALPLAPDLDTVVVDSAYAWRAVLVAVVDEPSDAAMHGWRPVLTRLAEYCAAVGQ